MKTSRLLLAGCLVAVMLFASCENRAYYDYYNNVDVAVPNQTCYEYLSSQSELSTFCAMLKQTGYDLVLSQSSSFTVWAPVNEALKSVDMNNQQTVLELVKTHISRFAYSTSAQRESKVTLLSGKVMSFTGHTFDTIPLQTANISTKNGLVHIINGCAIYKPNLWEMMSRTHRLDSISSYLTSLSKEEFSALLSTEIGTNAYGQPIYDSVFVNANRFLDQIADIDYEDTAYTVVFPDNGAWTLSYEDTKRYFVTRQADGGEAFQREKSRQAMTDYLVFSGKIEMNNLPDSLVTTSGAVIHNVDSVFKGVDTMYDCSNGYLYVARSLNIDKTDTWLKPIKMEAENSSWGRTQSNADVYVRSSVGMPFSASKDAYLEADRSSDASSLSKVYVEYPIPNLLSTTYNICCVFIPESITETTSRPCKVSFQISYRGANDNMVVAESLRSAKQTDGTKIDSVLVGQHSFTFCNLFDEETSVLSDISTKLRLKNEQKSETKSLTKVMRPDVIIFEPVTKD